MIFKITLTSLTAFLNKVIKTTNTSSSCIFCLVVLFGIDTPFPMAMFITNVTDVLNMLGEDALLALVALVIIFAYLKKD